MTTSSKRPVGLRTIIVYKVAKAGIVLALAVWLTVAPGAAYRELTQISRQLSEGGTLWAKAGAWIQEHLSSSVVTKSAILAWLDGVWTALEAALLLSGHPWAEWMVVVGLGLLLPFELFSVVRYPGFGKLTILLVNGLVVGYLAHRRWAAHRALHSATPSASGTP